MTPVEPKQSSLNSELHSRTGGHHPIGLLKELSGTPEPGSPAYTYLAKESLRYAEKIASDVVETYRTAYFYEDWSLYDELTGLFRAIRVEAIKTEANCDLLTAEVERLKAEVVGQYTDGLHDGADAAADTWEKQVATLTAEIERLRAALEQASGALFDARRLRAALEKASDAFFDAGQIDAWADARIALGKGAPHMIKPEQIPRAVIDVMMKAITYPAGATVETIYEIRMAAALNAWEGAFTDDRGADDPGAVPLLILPLQKEGE